MVFKLKNNLFIHNRTKGAGGGSLHKKGETVTVPDDFHIDLDDPSIEIIQPPKNGKFNTEVSENYKKMIEKEEANAPQAPEQNMRTQQKQMVDLLAQVNQLTKNMIQLSEDNKRLKEQVNSKRR